MIQVNEYIEVLIDAQLIVGEAQKAYCLKNLSKFKIEDAFVLQAKQSIEVPILDSRTECPPYVRIIFEEAQESWAADILKILKRLCNYENAKYLIIEKQREVISSSSDYKELLLKVEEFKNIKMLDLPFDIYNGVADDIIIMLKNLHKLDILKLNCVNKDNDQLVAEETQRICQYVIGNITNLRKIVFCLNIPIETMKVFECHQRASPLTILFNIKERTYHILDPRFGMRSILADDNNY